MSNQGKEKSKEIKKKDMISVNKNEVMDKDEFMCILESLIHYEGGMEFNIQTSTMLETNFVDYVEGEFVTPKEQIRFHEGKESALLTIWSMVDDGVFDIHESEVSNERKNNSRL